MLLPAAASLVLLLCLAAPCEAGAAQEDASGVFLVAAPRLQDPNFRETVVLVTYPLHGAPLGVIINRPLEPRIGDLFPEYAALKARDDAVYMGGPVSRYGLVFLVRATHGPPRSIPVLRDVFLTGDADWVNARLEQGELTDGLRVYAGYAGWAPGQLQNEVSRGDWYLLPADADAIFTGEPASLWPELSKRAMLRHTGAPSGARRNHPL